MAPVGAAATPARRARVTPILLSTDLLAPSIRSTTLPSSASWMAMGVIAVAALVGNSAGPPREAANRLA